MYEYTHLIAEARSRYSANLKPYASTHDILDSIEAFHQIAFNYLSIPPVSIKTKPVLFILRRKENYRDFLKNVTAAEPYVIDLQSSEELEAQSLKQIEGETIEGKITSREIVVAPKSEQESLQSKEKLKSREVSKSTEKELNSEKETESGEKQQKKSIKKSIRKLISKYRRTKADKTEKEVAADTAKVSVKKIIQQEKANIEREELRKIQQQVISLIESNPNIVNKDIIKAKIETTVMRELTSAIEPDSYKQFRSTKPDREHTRKMYPEMSHENKRVVAETEKIPKIRSPLKEKKPKLASKEDVLKGSEEKLLAVLEETVSGVMQENAVDIYESPLLEGQEPYEEVALDSEAESEVDVLTDADIEVKLQLASEQIENLMTIISEIVDTIEVQGDEEENR